MQQTTPLVSATYLTTEEDYRNFRMAVGRLRIGRVRRTCLMAAGVLMMAAGAALLYFQSGRLYDNAAWCALILIGMFCASYCDILSPYLIRRQANAEFAVRKRMLVAQSILFYPNYVKINTDRYNANILYDMLYKCVEDSTLFLFYTGMGEVRFLPKRVLAEGEAQRLSALLRPALKGRYVNA